MGRPRQGEDSRSRCLTPFCVSAAGTFQHLPPPLMRLGIRPGGAGHISSSCAEQHMVGQVAGIPKGRNQCTGRRGAQKFLSGSAKWVWWDWRVEPGGLNSVFMLAETLLSVIPAAIEDCFSDRKLWAEERVRSRRARPPGLGILKNTFGRWPARISSAQRRSAHGAWPPPGGQLMRIWPPRGPGLRGPGAAGAQIGLRTVRRSTSAAGYPAPAAPAGGARPSRKGPADQKQTNGFRHPTGHAPSAPLGRERFCTSRNRTPDRLRGAAFLRRISVGPKTGASRLPSRSGTDAGATARRGDGPQAAAAWTRLRGRFQRKSPSPFICSFEKKYRNSGTLRPPRDLVPNGDPIAPRSSGPPPIRDFAGDVIPARGSTSRVRFALGAAFRHHIQRRSLRMTARALPQDPPAQEGLKRRGSRAWWTFFTTRPPA